MIGWGAQIHGKYRTGGHMGGRVAKYKPEIARRGLLAGGRADGQNGGKAGASSVEIGLAETRAAGASDNDG